MNLAFLPIHTIWPTRLAFVKTIILFYWHQILVLRSLFRHSPNVSFFGWLD